MNLKLIDLCLHRKNVYYEICIFEDENCKLKPFLHEDGFGKDMAKRHLSKKMSCFRT